MTIARSPENQAALVAKFGGPVAPGAQLVVADDDACVFSRHGAAIRVLETGSYQVPAEFAGPDIEAWFVSCRLNFGVKFAGQLGTIETPMGTMSKILGDYAWRVTEPSTFLAGFVGFTRDSVSAGDVSGYLGKLLTPAIVEALAPRAAGFNPGMLYEIGQEAVSSVNAKLADVGARVVELGTLNIRA